MTEGPAATARATLAGHRERILVLTPTGRDAGLAARAISAAGLACTVCADLGQVRRHLEDGAVALLLADEALPPKDAPEWDAWMPPEPPWSAVPMVVLTRSFGRDPHRSRQLRRLEARGNVSFLQRPVPKVTLISALRAAVESRRRQYVIRDFLEELKRSEVALIEADRRKDEFLAILAHELRNPLAPIVSGVEILRLSKHDPAVVETTSRVLERQVAHIVRLVDDLLDVSRITRNMITLHKEPIDVPEAVRRAAESYSGAIAERVLTIDLGDEPLVVQGDFVRLVQVFSNILDNAIKYTGKGGRIRVTAGRDGGDAVVAVSDDGIGIAPGMLTRIFEIFSRGTPERVAGLGVGLTLVRQLVQLHRGSVETDSEGPGKGATFTVRLPLAAGVVAAPEAPAEDAEVADGGTRVLVVDDNAEAADALGMLLELLGAQVRVTYDGETALASLPGFRPGIAILDLSMPDMDGYDVARRMRSDPAAPGLTLVALTGWSQAEVRARVKEAGFDRYLIKPVKATALREILAGGDGDPPRP